jgi:hypothetical protein
MADNEDELTQKIDDARRIVVRSVILRDCFDRHFTSSMIVEGHCASGYSKGCQSKAAFEGRKKINELDMHWWQKRHSCLV